MAVSARSEAEFKRSMNEKIKQTFDPVEKLRLKCLARGIDGIRALGRSFTRVLDSDRDHRLDFVEFQNGINKYGLTFSNEEMKSLFNRFDVDGSGKINFNEFLERLRPPMSERRRRLIDMAFCKLDTTGDGQITVDDLKRVYDVRQHPKFQNGEWSETKCLSEFLKSFDGDNKDGVVTREEFLNYYSAVSASIDQDPYFDLMMRNAYQLRE
ncbi:calcyphosin-like protein [Watersipora subatra]|uniref:calcyphosin-like protein n=1 Tax=Watersipora subatra TaxID=2589382 RepID=UPI00355BAE3F